MQNQVSRERAVRSSVLKILGGKGAESHVKELVQTLPIVVGEIFLLLSTRYQDLPSLKSLLTMRLTENHRAIFFHLIGESRNIWNVAEIASHRGTSNLEHFLSHGPRNIERLRFSLSISNAIHEHWLAGEERKIKDSFVMLQENQRRKIVKFSSEQKQLPQRAMAKDLEAFLNRNEDAIQTGRSLMH